MIDYYFKSAPKDEVTLDILDSQGKLVTASFEQGEEGKRSTAGMAGSGRNVRRRFPRTEGMNRFAWDLHYDDPVQIAGRVLFRRGTARAARAAGRLSGEVDRGRKKPDSAVASGDGSAHQRCGRDLPKAI